MAILIGEIAVSVGIAPTMVEPEPRPRARASRRRTCLVHRDRRCSATSAEARESAEIEVRERGEHFESLIRHAADMIGVVGHDLRIRSVSPAIGSDARLLSRRR